MQLIRGISLKMAAGKMFSDQINLLNDLSSRCVQRYSFKAEFAFRCFSLAGFEGTGS